MPIEEALATAESEGLDLVEVAATARPPVVWIMDYDKSKYEEARKAPAARKNQHQILIKEVKFRPGIEPHDFDFKIRHARRFLEEGNKVKVTMMFRGRQIANPEAGREVMVRVAGVLDDVGKVEQMPSMEGRTMIMIVGPKKTAR
jgi:translation initiation factor IF-3